MTEREFDAEEAAGLYALTWRAHGLAYGIPQTIEDDLKAGRAVIVNVSRAIIDEARQRFPQFRVISICASSDVIAERLKTRGRENEKDILERLERAEAYTVTGSDVIELTNDGILKDAIEKFASILQDSTN